MQPAYRPLGARKHAGIFQFACQSPYFHIPATLFACVCVGVKKKNKRRAIRFEVGLSARLRASCHDEFQESLQLGPLADLSTYTCFHLSIISHNPSSAKYHHFAIFPQSQSIHHGF
jgi:hypothetical protein